LKDGPCSVSQIIEATGFSQPLVSFHLKLLREAGIVTTERKGTFVYNSLSDQELPKIIHQFAKYSVHAKESKHAEMPFSCACPPWMKR
jgi:DNA-binding transcriptional ArsR family regulator